MRARFTWTDRAAGDLAGDLTGRPAPVEGPAAGAPWPWTWLHQVHGPRVVTVTEAGQHAGAEADAAVTATPGCALAVRTADCAPVVLVGERAVGVVHAGWRGLAAGIVAAAVDAMAALGAPPRRAHLGPCIRPGCYEFGERDLADLEARFGPAIRATTTWATPALDLPAAVHAALAEAGVDDLRDESGCTACDRRWWSHRARGDAARAATVAWLEPT